MYELLLKIYTFLTTGSVDGDSTAVAAAQPATGSLTFTANPSNNDTLPALNGFSGIVFKSAAGAFPQVQIGVTLNDTLDSLVAALNASASPLLNIATYVHPTGEDYFSIDTDVPGAAGNAYTIGANTANIARSGATLTGGSELASNEQQRWPVILHKSAEGGSVETGTSTNPLAVTAPENEEVVALASGLDSAGGRTSALLTNRHGRAMRLLIEITATEEKTITDVIVEARVGAGYVALATFTGLTFATVDRHMLTVIPFDVANLNEWSNDGPAVRALMTRSYRIRTVSDTSDAMHGMTYSITVVHLL